MAHRDNRSPRPQRADAAVATPLALGFVGLGGMVAWAAHFWVVFILVEIACRAGLPGVSVLGLSALQILLALAALAFGAVALAAAIVSIRINQRTGVGIATDRDVPRALDAFMGQTGLLLSVFFLAAIVLETVPAFVLRPCV